MKYVEKLDGIFFLHWESLWPGVIHHHNHQCATQHHSEMIITIISVAHTGHLPPEGDGDDEDEQSAELQGHEGHLQRHHKLQYGVL